MTVLDYILEGLENALVLERELGIRAFECDRSLLLPVETASRSEPSAPAPEFQAAIEIKRPAAPREILSAQKSAAPEKGGAFVFLHDRPLSVKADAMIARILDALKTAYPGVISGEELLCYEGTLPKSAVYVVLGSAALKKWFPEFKASPGMWVKAAAGAEILVTYSPEYILRFGEVTPAVQKIKKDMWTSLKAVPQRVSQLTSK